jgi:formate dehydrogenase major subunit
MIANIALLSGHIGSPRDGILQVKSKNNSQGLIDLGIRSGAEAMDGVKALLIFGEDVKADLSGLEFLMVSDTHVTDTVAQADVVLPGTGFANTDGTYTNTERRLVPVERVIVEDVVFSNWEIASEIAHVYEVEFGWEDEFDISEEMDDRLAKYAYAEMGEVLDDVLAPTADAKFVVVGDAPLVDPMPCTDNLMNMINERLPKPVK